MKALFLLATIAFSAAPLQAGFRTWTRTDGKTASLEVIDKSGSGKELKGTFRMRDGRTVELAAADLSDADARFLEDFRPPAGPSVYDSYLDDDLVKLDGGSLEPFQLERKPTKYYLFYHTASWCGSCRKFTPSLAKFRDAAGASSHEYEIIVVTKDDNIKSMAANARHLGIDWPHIKLSKVKGFREKFPHPGAGVPNLVLTDLEGNILSSSYAGNRYVGPFVVMNHLIQLLGN